MKLCKLTLSLIVLAAASLTAQAKTALQVSLSNGEKPTYVLGTKPEVTFNGADMVVSVANASTCYAMADVVDLQFVDVEGVDDILTDSDSVLSYCGGVIEAPGHEITVYSLAGTVVARGDSQLSTDNLASGVYVVTAGKQSLKIIK